MSRNVNGPGDTLPLKHYVYILSTYGEDGAEEVIATLDRTRLLAMVDERWADVPDDWRARAKQGLAEWLLMEDAELADTARGHACHPGWGGMQLHVVTLR